MSTTISNLNFNVGEPIIIQGLTDVEGAVFASIGDVKVAIDASGSFEFSLGEVTTAGSYPLTISILAEDSSVIGNESLDLVISEVVAPTEPTPTEPTPVEPTPTEPTPTEPTPVEPTPTEPTPVEPTPTEPTPTEPTPVIPPQEVTTMSTEAQNLIDNQSNGLTYISRIDGLGTPSDTDNVKVYPGVGIGFTPLSASAHSASSANEFKIMPDDVLAHIPAAGYTGGRGTGNPEDFGKYPVRGLMKDTRGEFFSKDGDFDPTTVTQYPLGRTADILENSNYPVGFTTKDAKGYSTSTTRGGVDASPFPTGGITF